MVFSLWLCFSIGLATLKLTANENTLSAATPKGDSNHSIATRTEIETQTHLLSAISKNRSNIAEFRVIQAAADNDFDAAGLINFLEIPIPKSDVGLFLSQFKGEV